MNCWYRTAVSPYIECRTMVYNVYVVILLVVVYALLYDYIPYRKVSFSSPLLPSSYPTRASNFVKPTR